MGLLLLLESVAATSTSVELITLMRAETLSIDFLHRWRRNLG